MYRSFSIKNFRCFDELTVEGIGRINLIAGKNNVGKTALLEALWVHHGAVNPELCARVGAFRGIDTGDIDTFMGDLFRGFDRSSVIELSSKGNWGSSERRLKITLKDRPTFQVPLPATGQEQLGLRQSSSVVGQYSNQLAFEYLHDSGEQLASSGWLVERVVGPGVSALGMEKTQQLRPHHENSIFLAARNTMSSSEDAARYSQLEINGQQEGVLEILQSIEPQLSRLAVISARQAPSIYADVGMGRLIPIQLLGDGMSRILSLSLAIATCPGGMTLVDEIENGIHHSVMERVWKAVGIFARSYDVQLFATTHSYECIGAAHRAFESEEEDELRLFRIERNGEGKYRSVKFDKERIGAAYKFNMDVI